MREILFRGKKVSNNEWVYGCLVNNVYGASKPIIITDSDYDDNNCVNFDWDFVMPQTLGEFTGTKDKNGVKIFEGDIIKLPLSKKNCKVIYKNGYFFLAYDSNGLFTYTSLFADDVEVIGNLYDNPELLEGSK